ncbi:MAG TPA: HD domain-containing protein [Spirochaetia bacterium]|nr:HD domain-containing protein [Spirochaetia bacterium]
MNRNHIDTIARRVMIGRKAHSKRETGYIYYHGTRVARIALELLDSLQFRSHWLCRWLCNLALPSRLRNCLVKATCFAGGLLLGSVSTINRDTLFVAALFHDVGKGMEPHAEIGATMAREALKGIVSDHELEEIGSLIRMHNRRGQGSTMAEHLIQDADLLDHFGSQSVWLCFYYSSLSDKPGEEALEYRRSTDMKGYLEYCRKNLNLDLSRRVLERRLAFEDSFFSQFKRELSGRL